MTATPNSDPLLHPSRMRLALGEMTPAELRLAQSAIRRTHELLQERGWSLVPRDPPPELLTIIALRMDHSLAIPGYYDHVADPGFAFLGRTHDQVLSRTIAMARAAHESLVKISLSDHIELLIAQLQQEVAAELAPGNSELATVVRSAVRYGLGRPDMTLLPSQATHQILDDIVGALEKQARELGPMPEGVTEDGMRMLWRADASRVHEEVVGLGFYHQHAQRTSSSP